MTLLMLWVKRDSSVSIEMISRSWLLSRYMHLLSMLSAKFGAAFEGFLFSTYVGVYCCGHADLTTLNYACVDSVYYKGNTTCTVTSGLKDKTE